MGVTGSTKSKSCWFYFLTLFSSERDEIGEAMKRLKVNTLVLLFDEIFDPYEYRMNLFYESYSSVRPSGRPSVFCGKNFNVGHYAHTIQTLFFSHLLLTFTIFNTAFTDLDLVWGVTRSAQGKTYWLHVLAHFSSDQDEI